MHFEVRILLERAHRHERAPLAKLEALLGAAVVACLPGTGQKSFQFAGGGPGAQRAAEIDAARRVETQIPDTVGREAAAIAAPAEGLGRRRDDTEGRAIGEGEAI